MEETLSIGQNIQAGELEIQLKQTTSLPENQIKEIVPVILGSISEIQKLEGQSISEAQKLEEQKTTRSTTQEDLLELNQLITDDSKVLINMKLDEVTNNVNNISITINNISQSYNLKQKVSEEKEDDTKKDTHNVEPDSVVSSVEPDNVSSGVSEMQTDDTKLEISEVQPDNAKTDSTEIQGDGVKPEVTVESDSESNGIDSEVSGVQSDNMVYETQVVQGSIDSGVDIHTVDGFLLVLDKLLEEIKDTKLGTSKKGLLKAGKETMDIAKSKLKQYKKQIETKKSKLEKHIKKGGNPQIIEADIVLVQKLKFDIDEVRKSVGLGQWSELSNLGSFVYNSPENIKKAKKRQTDTFEFNQILEQELKDAAIQSIFLKQSISARDFYRRIADGTWDDRDYQIFVANSDVLIPSFQRCRIRRIPTLPTMLSGGTAQGNARLLNGRVIENISGNPRVAVDYRNMDRGETLQTGGVAGLFDKLLDNFSNMTPGQKETWKGIGVLSCIAGGIYGLYKFYASEKRGFLAKAGITALAIFTSQALTGEGPLSIINKLMMGGLSMDELKNKFGNLVGGMAQSDNGVVAENQSVSVVPSAAGNGIETVVSTGEGSESVSEIIVPAMYSFMVFNASTKVSDIDTMTNQFKNDQTNESWRDFYNKSCKKLEKNYTKEAAEGFKTTFTDRFDEEKWKNWLASFGITDSTDRGESIYGLSTNATLNEMILAKFKADNGVKEVGNKDLDGYIERKRVNNQPIDVDDLDEHKKDWFEENVKATDTQRPEDVQNREKLGEQVDKLALNVEIKSNLKEALNIFYDERSIESKPNPENDFSLKMEDSYIVLTSHSGYESKIDINTNQIVGFGKGITFTNLSDLLNTADLANKILESQKGKIPKGLPPFQYKGPGTVLENGVGSGGRGIYFNDAEFGRNLDFDTRVLSGGWGGTIGKIDTLSEHPNDFANYLSERREEINKVSLNQYPLVGKLGIDFYANVDEVQRLNKLLELIKGKGLRSRKETNNPFDIDGGKLVFDGVDGKKTIKENVFSEFPTLEANKTKFLDALNNVNNGMYEKSNS